MVYKIFFLMHLYSIYQYQNFKTLNPFILPSSFKMKYKMFVKIYRTLNNMDTSFSSALPFDFCGMMLWRGKPTEFENKASPFIKTILEGDILPAKGQGQRLPSS